MAKTWRFKIRSSVGGTAKGHQFTNTVHINTNFALDSAEMLNLAQGVAGTFRFGFLDIVTIQSVTISDPARQGQGYDPAQVRTIGIGLNGQKVSGAEHPEIKEVVAKIRLSGSTGRPGMLSVRMAIFDSEVTGVGDGEPNAVGMPTGVGDIVTNLNAGIAAGTAWHIWNRNTKGNITDRPVIAAAYAGVGHRDAHIRRKGKRASTKAPAWTKEAVEVARKVLDLAGAYNIAKTGAAALEAGPVQAAVSALSAGASEVLPLLEAAAIL